MTASLRTQSLTFRYPGGFALGPIDLDLGPGLHWLRGQNGAGKTTLMKCLCGGLRPSAGSVSLAEGDPVRDHRARRGIAWMPAGCDLPDFLTVDEAWQMMAALRGAPRWDAGPLREALGLPGRLRLSACSAGQRKKASLLAALAGDPGVLLLDEPLANVDVQAAETLSGWLEGWRAERVVVLASHEALPLRADSEATLAAGAPLRWDCDTLAPTGG